MADNKVLYDNLLKSGKVTADDLGDFTAFDSLIANPENQRKLYKALASKGFSDEDLGDEATFMSQFAPKEEPTDAYSSATNQNRIRHEQEAAGGSAGSGGVMKDFGKGFMSGGRQFIGGAGQMLVELPNMLISSALSGGNITPGGAIREVLRPKTDVEKYLRATGRKMGEWAKEGSEDVPDTKAAFLGQLIPQTALFAAALLSRNPAAITTAAGITGLSAGGGGLQAYDDYVAEKGIEPDENARMATAAAYTAAEYAMERLGIDKLVPKGIKNKILSHFIKENAEAAGKFGTELLQEFYKKTPGVLREAGEKFVAGAIPEAAQEAGTSVIQMAVDDFIMGKESDEAWQDWGKNVVDSAWGGFAMGGMLAPFSLYAERAVDRARRKQQGEVAINKDEEGNVWELVRVKDTENPSNKKGKIIGISPSGKVNNNIDPELYDTALKLDPEKFYEMKDQSRKAGNVSQDMMREAQYGAIRNRVNSNIQRYGAEDGNVHMWTDARSIDPKTNAPKEWFVIKADEAGMAIMMDKEGNKKIAPAAEVRATTQVYTPDDLYNVAIARFDQQNPIEEQKTPEAPDTFAADGKEWKVTGVSPEGLWTVVQLDEKTKEPIGGVHQLTPAEQQAIMSQMAADPTTKPETREIQVGDTSYTLSPTTTGTWTVDGITNKKTAEEAFNNIMSVLEDKVEARLVRTPSGSPFTPDTYSLEIREKPVEAPKPATYAFNGENITREEAEGFVKVAETKEDLKGLEFANDAEFQALIDEKFKAPEPKYTYQGRNVTRAEAKALLKLGKTEGLIIENDEELAPKIKEEVKKIEETQKAPVPEQMLSGNVGNTIRFEGKLGKLQQDADGVYTMEADGKTYIVGNSDITLEEAGAELRTAVPKVEATGENTVAIRGKSYTIGTDQNGNINKLTDEEGNVVTNERWLIAAEIERNKQEIPNVSEAEKAAGIVDEESLAVDGALNENMTEGIAALLDEGFTDATTEAEFMAAKLWAEDAIARLEAQGTPYAMKTAESLYGMLTVLENEHKERFPEGKPQTTGVEKAEKGKIRTKKDEQQKAEGQQTEGQGRQVLTQPGVVQAPKEVVSELTEDGEGNFVFVHYSNKKLDELNPEEASKQPSRISSQEELAAKGTVGGVVDLYTHPEQQEAGTGSNAHIIKVPKEKVYHLQSDPLRLYDEAKARFEEAHPGIAFGPNYQAAWISKVANEKGFDVLITDWARGPIAKLTKPMKVDQSGFKFGTRPDLNVQAGQKVDIRGLIYDVLSVEDDFINVKSEDGTTTMAVPRKHARRSISRVVPQVERNDAGKTQEFFSTVVKGESDKFRPSKPWTPLLPFNRAQRAFRKAFDKFKGNFDEHIATSIPAFRDVQIKVGSAITRMFGKTGGLVYDLGGSEGGFAKAITELSDGRIRSINLDPNPDMQAAHNATPVAGSEFVAEAFHEGFDGYKAHKPSEKADVVHESMTFQFIQPGRKTYIKEIAEDYLKEDGVFITEEKFQHDDPAQYKANEEKKNKDYKTRFYTQEQINDKQEKVLVGMAEDQANFTQYMNELGEYFKYVGMYWDGGNFKGIIATNSKEKFDAFMKEVGDTTTEFSESNNLIDGLKEKQPVRTGEQGQAVDGTDVGETGETGTRNTGSAWQERLTQPVTNIDEVPNGALYDEVYSRARALNIELSVEENAALAAFVKQTAQEDNQTALSNLIDNAIEKFGAGKKAGTIPQKGQINRTPQGSNVTSPDSSYNEGVANRKTGIGKNIWVRNTMDQTNEGRTLMVQFAPSTTKATDKNVLTQYFDKLYRFVKGYDRTSDFWEVPAWMGRIASMHEGKADVLVVRDVAEADALIKEAGYGSVVFSAMDVVKENIETLVKGNPDQQFHVGQYVEFKELDQYGNAKAFKSVEEYAKAVGVPLKYSYDYSNFEGTAAIPRLRTSQGCKFHCAFCSNILPVKPLSEEEIMQQVEDIKFMNAKLVYIGDKAFGQAPNYKVLDKIYARIKEYNPEFEGFIVQTSAVDVATGEAFTAENLAASHIKYIELGIETANDDILTKLKKKHSHRKFADAALRIARANNVKVIPNVIVGLAGKNPDGSRWEETAETYKNTLDWLEANKDVISHINVYALAIYENTEIADNVDVVAESDSNENIVTKSFHQNPEVHKQAMDAFLQFGMNQIKETEEKTLTEAEAETNTTPTQGQIEAGNYRKGRVKVQGFNVAIENPVGSTRSGVDAEGNPWSVDMQNTYGYFEGTASKDGDEIDVFIGPKEGEGKIFVIDQVNDKGAFDEHKVMMGFNSEEEAAEAYLSNYEPGWEGLGAITEMSRDEFKEWLNKSKKTDARVPVSEIMQQAEKEALKKAERILRENRFPMDRREGETVRDMLQRQADTVRKVLSKIAPNVDVVLFETQDEYAAAMKKVGYPEEADSKGTYITFSDGSAKIYINVSKADATTIAHEAAHAIFASLLKLSPVTYKKFKNQIAKALRSDLKADLLDFADLYSPTDQGEEFLVELTSRLSSEVYPKSVAQRLKEIVNKYSQKWFGFDFFSEAAKTKELIRFFKHLSNAIRTGTVIDETYAMNAAGRGVSVPAGGPVSVKASKLGKARKVRIDPNGHNLSFVAKEDLIDIVSLVKEIEAADKKVWFWTADQLGRGFYFDEVINGEHYFDAGPSYMLDPENRKRRIVWATGMPAKELDGLIDRADYVFLVSGSPEVSKLFNKSLFDLFSQRVGDFASFKEKMVDIGRKVTRETLAKYDSWEDLRESPDRKPLLIDLITTGKAKNSEAKQFLESRNAIIDYEQFRDGFFRDNGFVEGDIMGVFVAESVSENPSTHSTYNRDVVGDVIGIPDRVVSARDIMPDDIAAKLEGLTTSQAMQVIAPYGKGVRSVKAQRTLKVDGKERSVTNSLGELIHITTEGIENFWRWFGESKVVDAEGRPKVVYHGTQKKFDSFNPSAKGLFGDGMYFAYNERYSENYKGKKGRILSVYIKASNPFDTREDVNETNLKKLADALNKIRALKGKEPLDMSSDIAELLNKPKEVVVMELQRTWGSTSNLFSTAGFDAIIGDEKVYGAEIVVFEPTQIKSADFNTGEFAPTVANIKAQKYYSPTEKALGKITQNKGRVDQFKVMLLKNGAKQAELDWMGWDERFPDPAATVTKADIAKWISAKKVNIGEVVKGNLYWEGDNLLDGGIPVATVFEDEDGDWSFNSDYSEGDETFVTRGEAMQAALELVAGDTYRDNATKFDQWVEPGGENYNERLFTLERGEVFGEIASTLNYARNTYGKNSFEYREVKRELMGRLEHEYGFDYTQIDELFKEYESQPDKFTESHWDEPNVLFHTRTTERVSLKPNPAYRDPKTHIPDFDTDYELVEYDDHYKVKRKESGVEFFNSYSKAIMAENNMNVEDLKKYLMEKTELGKRHTDFIRNNWKNLKTKVLFIEEIQSDWAQKGRKEGFRDDKRLSAIDSELRELDRRQGELIVREKIGAGNTPYDYSVKVADTEQYDNLQKKIDELAKEGDILRRVQIPDMPFKQTSQWVNLAIRRMIQEAAEKGFDAIAWTTGRMNAERYDLSKQVDEIVYFPLKTDVGKYDITALQNGDQILSKISTLPEIEETYGKEIAKKVESLEGGNGTGMYTLQGEDLSVGGEGMIAFYDKIVPAAANKIGEKFGAKVEPMEIEMGHKGTQTVMSLPITPALKEEVTVVGVPMFKKSKTVQSEVDKLPATNISEEDFKLFIEHGEYAMVTGENPGGTEVSAAKNLKLNKKAEKWLQDNNLMYYPIVGKFNGNIEHSFFVPGMTAKQAVEFAEALDQAAIAHSSGYVYKDNSKNLRIEGANQYGVDYNDPEQDNFSVIKLGDKTLAFKTNYDFTNTVKAYPHTAPGRKVITSMGDSVREMFQDSLLALKIWQEGLKSQGIKIRDFENAYDTENRSHGVILNRMNKFTAKEGKNLVDAISNFVKAGKLSLEEAKMYVIAKHGPERNRYFWGKEPDKAGQDFAGLTDLREQVLATITDPAERMLMEAMDLNDFADYYAQTIERRTGAAAATALQKAVSEATDFSLKALKEAGFLSQEQYGALKDRYSYYVPLRGWAETDEFDYSSHFGKSSTPLKTAKGRKTMADDPFAYILNMANTSVIAAERNRVKQAFGNLVRNNREALEQWVKFKPVYFVRTDIVGADGKPVVYETLDRPAQILWDEGRVSMKVPYDYKQRKTPAQAKEHEMEFYENGRKMVIVLDKADPAIIRAINGVKNHDWTTNWNSAVNSPLLKMTVAGKERTIIGAPGAATRYLSNVMTSLNPAFVLPNMIRDIPFAMLSEFVNGTTADALNLVPALRKAEGAVRRYIAGKAKTGNKYDDMYEEFLRSGAATGFVQMKDVDTFKDELLRQIKEANSTMDPIRMSIKGLRAGIGAIEKLSEWSENLTRFAVYINHREAGETAAEAANAAKNSSVNFNRKGRLSPAINGLFAFFNAGVQAGDKYLKMWGKNWKKMAAVHSWLMVQGFMSAMLMDLFGGDDEEEQKNYDKLSEYTRKNYLVIPMVGTDQVVTIPMPHVLRAFHGIGVTAYDLMSNRIKPGEAITKTLASIPSDIIPVDGNGLVTRDGTIGMKPFIPTAAKPLYEMALNENFMGQRIAPEPYTPLQQELIARTAQHRKNVNSIAHAFTDALYKLGGGDETEFRYVEDKDGKEHKIPSLLDVNPHMLEHLANSYLGGTGTFVGDVYKTTENILQAGIKMTKEEAFKEAIKEVEINSLPVVRRFVRTPSGDPLLQSYYETKREVERAQARQKKYKESVLDPEGAQKYFDSWSNMGMPIKMFEARQGRIDDIEASIRKLKNADETTVDMLEKSKRDAMREAVKNWEESKK